MKKYAWLLLPLLIAAKPYKAEKITIEDKVAPVINAFVVEKIEIYPEKEQVKILVKYGYQDGAKFFPNGDVKGIVYKDKKDIQSTPRNEFDDKYSKFMKEIGIDMRKLESYVKGEVE